MPGTLEITVIKGEHLPDAALVGQQVPYFQIHVAGQRFNTKAVHGNGKHPVFDELIPVQIGGNEQHFRIHLWHQHPLTGDKEIAHAEVPFFEIIGGGSQERRVPLFNGNGDPCGHVLLLLRFVPSGFAVPAVGVVEVVAGGGGGAVIIEEGRPHHNHHHHGGGRVVEEVIVENRRGQVEAVVIEEKHHHHHHGGW